MKKDDYLNIPIGKIFYCKCAICKGEEVIEVIVTHKKISKDTDIMTALSDEGNLGFTRERMIGRESHFVSGLRYFLDKPK